MFYEMLPPRLFIIAAFITSLYLLGMSTKYIIVNKKPIILVIMLVSFSILVFSVGLVKYIEVYSQALINYIPAINNNWYCISLLQH